MNPNKTTVNVKVSDFSIYHGRIYIETDDDFYFDGRNIINWSVPDWKGKGFPELAGPFKTIAQAHFALKRNANNLHFHGYKTCEIVQVMDF